MARGMSVYVSPEGPVTFSYTVNSLPDGIRFTAGEDTISLTNETVRKALTEPVSAALDIPFNPEAWHEGIAEYGNLGVVQRNARNMGRDVRGYLRTMLPDLNNISSMQQSEAAQGTHSAVVRMADEDSAALYAREKLVTMPASHLIKLCADIGIEVDEFMLELLKGGERNHEVRLYHLDAAGADSEKLRKHMVGLLFKRIDLLSEEGVEATLVHRGDIAPDSNGPYWLRDVQIGALEQPVESTDWLPRWQVSFREGSVAHWRTIPVIGWAAVGNEWQRQQYATSRLKLDYRGGRIRFNEDTRTLTHYSPILGTIGMAEQAGITDTIDHRKVHRFFGKGFDRHEANRLRLGKTVPLPPTVLAALPAVVSSQRDALLTTEWFESIQETLIHQLIENARWRYHADFRGSKQPAGEQLRYLGVPPVSEHYAGPWPRKSA